MRLLELPDLEKPRRLAVLALMVAVIVSVVEGLQWWRTLNLTLGDTDDATRLVLMRGLASGQGWYDQLVTRYQPPVGVYMHWSRLLDGGLALLDRFFALFVPNAQAEWLTRFTWPLLWIVPAAFGALLLARRLSPPRFASVTIVACALILVTDQSLYAQFHPGRIDHHDAQMALCLLALAGAAQKSPNLWGSILAGVATGLGLAVGLEALVFDAAIGAGIALRFALNPEERRSAQAYGAALALTTLAAFLAQTPPWRWSVTGCDALAANLVAPLVLAGLGLVAIPQLTARSPLAVRLGALAALGLAAALLYLGLDPDCRHGPFANVDPRIRPFWLDHVQEVRPWWRIMKKNHNEGIDFIVPWILGIIAWIVLGLRRERRAQAGWILSGFCILAGTAVAADAIRMTGYAEWFAVPLIAAAAAEIVTHFGSRGVIAAIIAGLAGTPVAVTAVVLGLVGLPAAVSSAMPALTGRHKPPPKAKKKTPPDHCFDTASYQVLAKARPVGRVLSEIDLGPFVLAHTPHSAMDAPYHRMNWGILASRSVLVTPADKAEALARKLGVTYVLECRVHDFHADRDRLSPDSLQKRLDAGKPPAWLVPLSPKGSAIEVYRVKPRPA